MYTIIDINNQLHGPVGPETISKWIAEGRINTQTLMRKTSDENWQTIESFPQFLDELNIGEKSPQLSSKPPQQKKHRRSGFKTSQRVPRETVTQGTNGMAVAGRVCSLVSLGICVLGLLFGFLFFGIMGSGAWRGF